MGNWTVSKWLRRQRRDRLKRVRDAAELVRTFTAEAMVVALTNNELGREMERAASVLSFMHELEEALDGALKPEPRCE